MANPSTMGPPLSPRETRRSGRRSAQSVSSSKSPDSPVSESLNNTNPPPRPSRENSGHRPSLSTSSSNGRSKRLKQEDIDDSVGESTPPNGSAAPGTTTTTTTNGRGKRKTKEKVALVTDVVVESTLNGLRGDVAIDPSAEAEEEPSVTRCVCGSNVDEEGEFMVQCETCDVWQHGLCVGYENEGQVASIDYYCEQCRPDLHQDILKQIAKKARQSSANSHHNASVTSRLSRSHSPSHLLKPAKRRNTMNSRDAAFDESIKEIIEATAAEALAHDRGASVGKTVNGNGELPDDSEVGVGGRKKRKRTEDDALPKKRTRSASSASDHALGSNAVRDEEPTVNGGPKSNSASVPVSKSNGGRRQRGGGRKAPAPADLVISVEGDDGARTNKPRAKPGPTPKRPPPSTSHASGSGSHEHGTRRNNNNGVNGVSSHAGGGHVGGGSTSATTTAEASRAYKNSHAYVVSQQPLFTSWNLPDYLAHLEPMLPTDTPKPLEVRGSGVGPGGRESLERGLERGAKVKWPSKRMSVGDMNKRVRALVEWVGREQAGALDRGRRREALEKALKENAAAGVGAGTDDEPMAVDPPVVRPSNVRDVSCDLDPGSAASTMKQMEELMEELIGFQERFGPGAKILNDRGRRIVSG